MNLLFFATQPCEPVKQLSIELLTIYGQKNFTRLCSLEQLHKTLLFSPKEGAVLVLQVASSEELQVLVSLREMIAGIPLILILHNETDHHLHQAHQLRPRFLTSVQQNMAEVISVVDRLSQAWDTSNTLNSPAGAPVPA